MFHYRAKLIAPTAILGWAWTSRRPPVVLRRLRPYTFHVALAVYIPALLYADAQTRTLAQQHLLGVPTLAFLLLALLFLALLFSPSSERCRVWLLVLFATALELFSSGVWGVYAYRFSNVPLYVPPGHGLFYLFALRSARTPLMANHGTSVGLAALTFVTLWAIGGFTVGPLLFGRLDPRRCSSGRSSLSLCGIPLRLECTRRPFSRPRR